MVLWKLSLRPGEAGGGTEFLSPAKQGEELLAEPATLPSDMAFYTCGN